VDELCGQDIDCPFDCLVAHTSFALEELTGVANHVENISEECLFSRSSLRRET
jgi:hypothetical protein